MARTRQFDRGKALQAATRLFWTRGFAGASADDLVKEMGIARQSLYDTFGNKRDLYLEALRSYNAGNVSALIHILREEKSPREALKRVLLAPALVSQEEREMGCFGINSICEFGVSDPDVVGTRGGSSLALSAAIEALIDEAKQKGEIPSHIDTKTANNYIGCVTAGLKVAGRAGASSETLREIGEMAMTALAGTNPE
jgi:TetR/AcrR family transcriptional repressor of nem operon